MRTRLYLSFNEENPRHVKVLNLLREQKSVTEYVVQCILKDMDRSEVSRKDIEEILDAIKAISIPVPAESTEEKPEKEKEEEDTVSDDFLDIMDW